MNNDRETIEEKEHWHLLYAEPIEIELGFSLIRLANAQQPESLVTHLPRIRATLALELGLNIPQVRLRDNPQLKDNEYCIRLRANVVARGELYLDKVLALVFMEGLPRIGGIATTDPTFGMEAYWILPEEEETAIISGYTVVKPIVVLNTHINETFRKYADGIFDYNSLALYLQQVEKNSPFLALACKKKTEMVFSVLKQLLYQKVSIRDQQTILETIASTNENDPQKMTTIVRKNLYSLIFASVSAQEGIHAFVFGDDLVEMLRIQEQKNSQLSRELASQIAATIAMRLDECDSEEVIVLCPSSLRSFLAPLPKIIWPHLPLIFEDELPLGSCIVEKAIVSLPAQK